jgi:hypothetical protein
MTDRMDDLVRAALSEAPDLEPTDAEMRAVMAAVGAERPLGRTRAANWPQRGWAWVPAGRAARVAVASAAAVLVLGGGTLAVPAGRSAMAAVLDRVQAFFGGGDAPGTPLDPEPRGGDVLNWLEDAAPGTARVMARAGDERMVAFRRRGAGTACFSLGRHARECGGPEHWRRRFAGGVVAPLFTSVPDARGRVALWGVAGDAVTRVEVRYADGGSVAARVPHNGFVVLTDPARAPSRLVARGGAGAVLAEADLSGLRFGACTTTGGCR